MLNEERSLHGAPALARYVGMDATAQQWAEHMSSIDVLVHRPSVEPYLGEIIASGAHTSIDALNVWNYSPAHRNIMLDPAYHRVGIGYQDGYWCVVFS